MDCRKQELLQAFNQHLNRCMGLNFPISRLDDLGKGLERTASDLGIPNAEELVHMFSCSPLTPAQVQALARHLSVGETYFYRDKQVFKILENEILFNHFRKRRETQRRLNVWSAGCCTGEEAYSLAISVQKVIPDWRTWQVSVLGTDINSDYLEKAASGVYGNWSFRETEPAFRENYFTPRTDGTWQISQKLRDMVAFRYLNLADDKLPGLQNWKGRFDVIFCRNVLMYFSRAQAEVVVRNLCACLAPGGWLVLGPSEPDIQPGDNITAGHFPGLRIYNRAEPDESPKVLKRTAGVVRQNPVKPYPAPPMQTKLPQSAPQPVAPQKPAAPPRPIVAEGADEADNAGASDQLISLGRELSSRDKLQQALRAYDEAIEHDKLNPVSHYLRGIILQATGDYGESKRAFMQAIYLQPDFVMAYFAIGNLERVHGNTAEAMKCLGNAQSLAQRHQPGSILQESDGLTAGRLVQIIDAMREHLA